MTRLAQVGVAVIGDVLDINCWSNIPYYFYTKGKTAGIFNEPWRLDVNAMKWSRAIWNMKQILRGIGKGGYQYSGDFLDRAEAQIPHHYFSSTVISFNQVFPRASSVHRAGGRIYYYIDTPLKELFSKDSYDVHIPEVMQQIAIDQEKSNYAAAEAVVTMGSWVHHSLLSFYGLSQTKVKHILPGANLELPVEFKPRPFKPGLGLQEDLVLGFIGKDWKRKGLSFLLELRDDLASRGYKVKVKAIGKCPEELLNRVGLNFTGFLDKQRHNDEFVQIISDCHIGCLFSDAEALGISVLEFLRVGVPVAGFFHQGLVDTLMDGASLRFPLHAKVSEVADDFENFILNTQRQRQLKDTALTCMDTVVWEHCVRRFKDLL